MKHPSSSVESKKKSYFLFAYAGYILLLAAAFLGVYDGMGYDSPMVISLLEFGVALQFMAIAYKYGKELGTYDFYFLAIGSVGIATLAAINLLRSGESVSTYTYTSVLIVVFVSLQILAAPKKKNVEEVNPAK